MALTTSPDRADQKLTAEALRNLREARRKTQPQVAAALGISTQAWQKHEAGERKFSQDRIARVLAEIGATRADLDAERARILGRPVRQVAERGQSFVFDVLGRDRAAEPGEAANDGTAWVRRFDLRDLLGVNTEAKEMATDAMYPWAAPGELVFFDRDRYPRRGEGCVFETRDGTVHVNLYEKSDGSTLFVRELFPEERTLTFRLEDVKGQAVYAVRLRGG